MNKIKTSLYKLCIQSTLSQAQFFPLIGDITVFCLEQQRVWQSSWTVLFSATTLIHNLVLTVNLAITESFKTMSGHEMFIIKLTNIREKKN